MLNRQVAEEFHNAIMRKFQKHKVYSSFKNNIWGPDLANMHLVSKHNKRTQFLLCVIDIYS